MSGEALPKETQPEPGPYREAGIDLTLFASILLRRPFGELTPDDATIVRWAPGEAMRWHAAGRANDIDPGVLAHRIVYRALREQAADAPPIELAERGPRWEKVLRATCMLRHRQRAVLAAYYCSGMSPADAGRVVRAGETQARAVIESAVAGVAKLLGEPVDVRRSLRMAAARLRARSAAEVPAAPPAPARQEPRAVMRNWVAPSPMHTVVPASTEPGLSPVRLLVSDLSARDERVAVPSRARPPGDIVPAPRYRMDRRPLFAAAAAALVLAVIAPGLAVEPRASQREPVADAPVLEAVAPIVEVLAAPASLTPRAIRVRRGDSLWALAIRHLGDGARWRAIWRHNRGTVMTTGHRFTSPGLILPGWVLALPRRAPV